MRIVVVGGTGQVGSQVVDHLRNLGHHPVVVARSTGADVATGDGLSDALAGADAVIDVTNSTAQNPDETTAFFGAVTANLLAAEEAAGVKHHVALSILNMDRTTGNAHYAGKRHQEALVQAGPVPWTIVQAAQFFSFGEMVAGWTRRGDTVSVPPVTLQPVAVDDVAALLAEVASSEPRGVISIAGPEPIDLVELTARTFEAKGDPVTVVPTFEGTPIGPDTARDAFLAGPDTILGPTRVDDWLTAIDADRSAA